MKIPQPNFTLLKYLVCVLSKVKRSSKNHLNTYYLSLRIAPYVIWDANSSGPVCKGSLRKKVKGSDFFLWKQIPYCDPGIGNTSVRSLH